MKLMCPAGVLAFVVLLVAGCVQRQEGDGMASLPAGRSSQPASSASSEKLTSANTLTVAKAGDESLPTGDAKRNGGFRILPETAARDAKRPRVIYRCNEVVCNEAFQPSNEERDTYLPCDKKLGTVMQKPLKPYLRFIRGELVEKDEQKKACESTISFQQLLSATQPLPDDSKVEGAPVCRQYRTDRDSCTRMKDQGCHWVAYTSGHNPPAGGECVGGSAAGQ
jgi:hypothetical protein